MDKSIEEYFQEIGIDYEEVNDQLVSDCPLCGAEGKFYANAWNGLWDCKVCHEKGNLNQLRMALKNEKPVKRVTRKVGKSDTLVDRFIENLKHTPEVYNYMVKERKIAPEVLTKYQVGVDDRGNPTFPEYNLEGKLQRIPRRNLQYEKQYENYQIEVESNPDAKKPAKWYGSGQAGVMGIEILKEKPSSILLCEGHWDFLTAKTYGIQALCIPGAGNRKDEWVDLLESVNKIFICYDQDPAGQKGANDLAIRLGLDRCFNVTLPHNDLNDCLKEGMTKEEIVAIIKESKQFDVNGISKTLAFKDSILTDIFREGELSGFPSGFKQFDELTKGIREGESSIVSGYTSVGKTTFLKVLLYNLAKQGIPGLMFSLETPVRKLAKDLMSIHAGVAATKFTNEKQVMSVLQELDELPLHWYDLSKEKKVLDFAQFESYVKRMRDRYGVKIVVLDNLSRLVTQTGNKYKNSLENLDNTVVELDLLTKRLGVHLFIVAHVSKPEKGDMSQPPSMGNLRGSAELYYACDNIFLLHREIRPDADADLKSHVTVQLAKNREEGDTGVCYLRYDTETCKYYEE